MIVELEEPLASQASIMKYGLMDKFLWIEYEENIFLKCYMETMIGFMSASPTTSTGWQMKLQ
jgi:hypothetical protein